VNRAIHHVRILNHPSISLQLFSAVGAVIDRAYSERRGWHNTAVRAYTPASKSMAKKTVGSKRKSVSSSKKVSPSLAAAAALAPCDCRARNAFHQFRVKSLLSNLSVALSFAIPANTRVVIETITARITVPAGEMARLRLVTVLGNTASNLDLTVMPQGVVGGKQILVATHPIRAYADSLLECVVTRDTQSNIGDATVCISGYLEPLV